MAFSIKALLWSKCFLGLPLIISYGESVILCDFSPIAPGIKLFTYIGIIYSYMLFFWMAGVMGETKRMQHSGKGGCTFWDRGLQQSPRLRKMSAGPEAVETRAQPRVGPLSDPSGALMGRLGRRTVGILGTAALGAAPRTLGTNKAATFTEPWEVDCPHEATPRSLGP